MTQKAVKVQQEMELTCNEVDLESLQPLDRMSLREQLMAPIP